MTIVGERLSDPDYEFRVQRWLEDKASFHVRLFRSLKAYRHNNLSGWSIWSGAHWTTRTGLASSGPAIAYASGSTMSGWKAAALAGGLFVGHTAVSYLGQRSQGKKRGPNPTTIDAMVRIGDILSSQTVVRSKVEEKQAAIVAALGLLEVLAREVTCRKKGEVAVSLATYEGKSRTKMRLRFRNPGNDRPQNRTFDATDLLAHRACLAGTTPRIVHDLRGFGLKARKSPTQSAVSYRSFLIFPLHGLRDGEEKVIGFLSIDASTPYSFFGNRASTIVVNSQPIITHIQALL